MKELIILLIIVFHMGHATAKTSVKSVKEDCKEFKSCVEMFSRETGKKYIYSGRLEGIVNLSSNFDLVDIDKDVLFSNILYMNNLARIKLGGNTYRLIEAIDLRYESLPIVIAENDKAPDLPHTKDYYMLKYKIRSQSKASELPRHIRTLTSRYGRILEYKDMKEIHIVDTAENLLAIYSLITVFDN